MSLIVVGTMAFDAIETPFGKTDRIVGGSAIYVAYAASNFIQPVNQVSIIGYDFLKEELDQLILRGVVMDGVEMVKDKKSFFWSGRYHEDMNTRDTLITDLNVLADFKPQIPEIYQGSEFLMLGNLEIDVLLINDAEARQLSGQYSLVKAAKTILTMGPQFLIVKKGEHGALLFHDDRVFFAPALPLEDVFDPTGAGDTFAGGFIGHLAKTKDVSFENMKTAIIVGSALASFCVEKFGPTRLKEISKEDISKRLGEFRELVNFDIELV